MYKFSRAADPMAIPERQYASAAAVQFTTFTSCIGVLAKKRGADGLITGAHLSLLAPGDKPFTSFSATMLMCEAFQFDIERAFIIGHIPMWRNSDNAEIAAGFQKLAAMLQSLTLVQEYPLDNGTYGAELEGGAMQLTFV